MKRFSKKLALVVSLAMLLTGIFGISAIADDDDWHEDDYSEMYTDDGCYGYLSPVSSTSVNIGVGEQTTMQVQIYSCSDSNAWVQWSADYDGIVNILSDGECVTIEGAKQGYTPMQATLYVDGNVTDSDTFYVTVGAEHVDVSGVSINPKYVELGVGNYASVSYSVYPDNADNKSVNFVSSDNNIVRVDNAGNIFAVNPGTAYVSVVSNCNGSSDTCTVKVNASGVYIPVTGLVVNPSSASVGVGQKFKITPTVFPINATNSGVVFISSNPSIAKVDANGNVTGVSAGQTIISCVTNENGFTANTIVNVVAGASGASTAIDTRDPNFLYDVVSKVIGAEKNGTVTIQALNPMSYDSCVATALKARPDVKLVAVFPYMNGYYSIALPAGYDLASQLDPSGYIEWVNLAKKPGVGFAKIK